MPKHKPRKVASLAQWKKNRHPEAETGNEVLIPAPQGYLPGDEFHTLRINSHSLSGYGLRRGDRLVCYVTDDVREGDMVMIECLERNGVWAGMAEFDACGFWLNFNPKGRGWKPIYCYRAKTNITGRIVEALRFIDGELRRIPCSFPFRPIRKQAHVIQFKRRHKKRDRSSNRLDLSHDTQPATT